MVSCYHPDIEFSDPGFPDLKGWRAGAMWRMLIDKGSADLEITYSDIKADDNRGSAHWEAKYSFGKDKNPVHNIIDAEFEFKDGKIVKHTDRFDFWRWSRQALGAAGLFLGWTPMIRSKVQKESDTALTMYSKRKRLEPKKG